MANSMLQTGAVLLLEGSLNKLIASDSVTQQALAKLSGKVIEFQVTDAPIQLYILPHSHGVQLQQLCEHSDAKLQGSLSHFHQLAMAEDSSAHFFGNGISITGDTQLAARFQRIINTAKIDWQGLIASCSGDLIAAQLASLFNSGTKQFAITRESLELNIAEYLQEEAQTLPARPEVEAFIADIDSTRSAVDRLEARLNLLLEK